MGIQYHFVMRLKLPTPPNNSAKKFKVIGALLLVLGFFLSLGGTQYNDDSQFNVGLWVLCIGGLLWLVGRFKE
jgi:hypothetical protein